MSDTEDSDQQRKPYSHLVGEFLTAFVEIEALTYTLLKCMPQDKLTNYALSEFRDFRDRARFTQALVRSQEWSGQTREGLTDILDSAITLHKHRNQLAHNPASYAMCFDGNTGKFSLGSPKVRDAKTEKVLEHISEAQIVSWTSEAQSLIQKFAKWMTSITKS